MNKLIIRKKEKKTIGRTIRFCIDFFVFVCCSIIIFNLHPMDENESQYDSNSEKPKMIYIFHDYKWNEYILNDAVHGAASDWSYLFEDVIPEDMEWNNDSISNPLPSDENDLQSTSWINDEETGWDRNDSAPVVKDNQVSFGDIISDLWINGDSSWIEYSQTKDKNDNLLVIDLSSTWKNADLSNNNHTGITDYYTVTEESWDDKNNTLIIEKIDDNYDNNQIPVIDNDNQQNQLTAKIFSFVEEGRIIPILIPWNQLQFNNWSIGYIDGSWYFYLSNSSGNIWSGITIIDDYADCMTPWWYKIVHWDSVLAYKQMKNTPDMCHIERRLCRNGKLSWTYTQQWCTINKDYTYETRWWTNSSRSNTATNKGATTTTTNNTNIQHPNWYTTDIKPLWTWSFVFDRPSQTSTPEFHVSNNVRDDDIDLDQTKRPHWNCITPRWEEVKHWQFVQAFKHSNWFSDAPCEAQIRLCTMWELMWTYTESSCKTWDTSLIDWINWSPTRDTFSEEKLQWIRKQIKDEEKNYNKARKTVKYNENHDEILSILDNNN